ncbi:hypothetical protein L1987_48499 [Smallanthus sonchifolius]|uniref:Uncharacterized protein n=1 Tax=Smallanthus sonchifolius TaxID=185202 RepID=A0ACB9FS44_9ASTR|nr:hypothetical protein L1987_48499 [Smallanthus sonchifolius]
MAASLVVVNDGEDSHEGGGSEAATGLVVVNEGEDGGDGGQNQAARVCLASPEMVVLEPDLSQGKTTTVQPHLGWQTTARSTVGLKDPTSRRRIRLFPIFRQGGTGGGSQSDFPAKNLVFQRHC